MAVSIAHRTAGVGMALVGAPLLVWWLAAAASGDAAYAAFRDVFTYGDGRLNVIGWIVGVGLTWALFQHMMSGLRHLVLDVGAAYELRVNKLLAILAFVLAPLLTLVFWLYLGIK